METDFLNSRSLDFSGVGCEVEKISVEGQIEPTKPIAEEARTSKLWSLIYASMSKLYYCVLTTD